MTTKSRCDCVPAGEPSPHSCVEQCRANRSATGAMVGRRETVLPSVRAADGKFVRFLSESEAAGLTHGQPFEGGSVRLI